MSSSESEISKPIGLSSADTFRVAQLVVNIDREKETVKTYLETSHEKIAAFKNAFEQKLELERTRYVEQIKRLTENEQNDREKMEKRKQELNFAEEKTKLLLEGKSDSNLDDLERLITDSVPFKTFDHQISKEFFSIEEKLKESLPEELPEPVKFPVEVDKNVEVFEFQDYYAVLLQSEGSRTYRAINKLHILNSSLNIIQTIDDCHAVNVVHERLFFLQAVEGFATFFEYDIQMKEPVKLRSTTMLVEDYKFILYAEGFLWWVKSSYAEIVYGTVGFGEYGGKWRFQIANDRNSHVYYSDLSILNVEKSSILLRMEKMWS